MADKILVSNNTALSAKYGEKGANAVHSAMQALIAADGDRGLVSRYYSLDDDMMRRFGAEPATDPGDAVAAKQAIDRIHATLSPDHVLLVGGTDVVPLQNLDNPLFVESKPWEDPDQFVPSDLPYACDAPYGTDPRTFISPTRAVGRLPDIPGSSDPTLLVDLLHIAAAARADAIEDACSCFVLSAEVWKESTRLSLAEIGRSADGLLCSPPNGPDWSTELLGRRVHFLNCHGAIDHHEFFGESLVGDFPVCLDSSMLSGKVARGSMVAAESCYGALVYSPDPGQPQGVAIEYLNAGAWGYLGSSCISYGPLDTVGDADLLCSGFLKRCLHGRSAGNALLEARQQFVDISSPLDPVHLKTLAQFLLLGDPSIRITHRVPPTADEGDTQAKKTRKVQARAGRQMASVTPIAGHLDSKRHVPAQVDTELEGLAAKMRMVDKSIRSYPVERGNRAQKLPLSKGRKPNGLPAFHLMVGRLPADSTNVSRLAAVVAYCAEDKLLSIRQTFAKVNGRLFRGVQWSKER